MNINPLDLIFKPLELLITDSYRKEDIAREDKLNQQAQENWQSEFDYTKDTQREQMDWTKKVQNKTWEREDTALTRTMADAKSAGISPLSALGNLFDSGQTMSAPSGPGLPGMPITSANVDSAGTFLDLLNTGINKEKIRSNEKISELEIDAQMEMTNKKIDAQLEELRQRLEHEETKYTTELSQEKELKQTEFGLEESRQKQTAKSDEERNKYNLLNIKYLNDALVEANRADTEAKAIQVSQLYLNEVQQLTGNLSGNYQVYDSYDKYKVALTTWSKKYGETIDELLDEYTSKQTTMKGGGGNVGINFLQQGVNLGGQSTDLESIEQKYDITLKLKAWLAKNPVPVLQHGLNKYATSGTHNQNQANQATVQSNKKPVTKGVLSK